MWHYELPEFKKRNPYEYQKMAIFSLSDVRESTERAKEVLQRVRAAIAGMPPRICLPAEERGRLSARAFASTPTFVAVLDEGLRQQPDLYSDLQEKTELLSARNQELAVWQELRGVFGTLYAIAHERHLLAQSEALQLGTEIVDHLSREQENPNLSSEYKRRRSLGVFTAQWVLMQQRKPNKGKKARTFSPTAKAAIRAAFYRHLKRNVGP